MRMFSSPKFVLLCLSAIFLCSCAVNPTQIAVTVLPTAEPTLPGTATPTVIWFPPTATHTPFPTPIITPTADMRPDLGSIIFEDDFSAEKGWTLTQSGSGNVGFGKNELAIAIGETDEYLFSIREEPIFTDFYLEITAEPSLCRGLDEYGVLFRVSPSIDYYRFGLSCDGQVRLDRVSGGQASSPQPWMYSGSVPPGAPSSSRLGISAAAEELSFYVNGQFQFSVTDPLLASGGIGVFARSVNKQAVTVNFSDLKVYEVNP